MRASTREKMSVPGHRVGRHRLLRALPWRHFEFWHNDNYAVASQTSVVRALEDLSVGGDQPSPQLTHCRCPQRGQNCWACGNPHRWQKESGEVSTEHCCGEAGCSVAACSGFGFSLCIGLLSLVHKKAERDQ